MGRNLKHNKKNMMGLLRSAFILVAALAIVGGGTYSYFSTTDSSVGNTIATGTLAIDLQNQNSDVANSFAFHVTDLLPGGTALVNFDVKNNSATGVELRGAAFGAWVGVSSPNNNLMSVVKVERWNGSSWATLLGDGVTPITGMFYDSNNGQDAPAGTLFTVPAGGKDQFQLTVKLDPSTGDKYQGKTYDASVKVQARQVGASTWPANLEAQFE